MKSILTGMLAAFLVILFGFCLTANRSVAQPTRGALRIRVTDETDALILDANVTVKSQNDLTSRAEVNAGGEYDVRNLAPGLYEVHVAARGFSSNSVKQVAVIAGRTPTVKIKLSINLEPQDVTVKDEGISTDADRNANALVLRGRDLESLPTDPQALAATLQAMAGPQNGESGAHRRRRKRLAV